MESTTNKTLNVKSTTDHDSKVELFGDPDMWQLVCKASHEEAGWMKSTKIAHVYAGDHIVGCCIQVTTQQDGHVAEAVTPITMGVGFVDGKLRKLPPGGLKNRQEMNHATRTPLGQEAME